MWYSAYANKYNNFIINKYDNGDRSTIISSSFNIIGFLKTFEELLMIYLCFMSIYLISDLGV
jgi:hypothetical protein